MRSLRKIIIKFGICGRKTPNFRKISKNYTCIKMLLPTNKSPFSSLETMEEKYALSLLVIGYAFILKILLSPSLGFIASF
jgi:hypothetical protein